LITTANRGPTEGNSWPNVVWSLSEDKTLITHISNGLQESPMRTVLVVTEKILPISQTFICSQVNALRTFQPQYVGIIPSEPSLLLQQKPILLCSQYSAFARGRKILYRWTGIAPYFHQRVRETKAVLVHAHFGENGPIALYLANALKVPLVMHLRGGAEIMSEDAIRRKSWALPFLLHKETLCKRAALFFCVSEFILQKAIDRGFPKEKLRLQYTGIDLTQFSQGGGDRERDLVLYVGRLVEYKGATHLIRAMGIVREVRPTARVVLIGDGPLRPSLERLAKEANVSCEFLGAQPSNIVRKWLSRARVFCAPSMTLPDGQAEALGNVFTEAQAMGVPVVTYHHGGIPEAVLHGQTGLLAPERDVDTLAKYIIRYLSDDRFWNECRLRGIEWVRQSFDVRVQTARLEKVYEEVLTQASVRERR
jgi:glycosyltransferase involved in cell wall biosynthesis